MTALDDVIHAVRSMINVKNCVFHAALLIAALCPCIAGAALGESRASVQADAARLHGAITVAEHANFQLHEIRLPSGTLLREFVGPDGKVFAVAWKGPTVPNLRQAFGNYFAAYATVAGVERGGHGPLQIQRDDLVMQAGGHMRAFAGRAYLPQAVPTGVDIGELH